MVAIEAGIARQATAARREIPSRRMFSQFRRRDL